MFEVGSEEAVLLESLFVTVLSREDAVIWVEVTCWRECIAY